MTLTTIKRSLAFLGVMLCQTAFGAITITSPPPAPIEAADATTITLQVSATSDIGSAMVYQWYKTPAGGGTQAVLTGKVGATSNKLTLSALKAADSGTYSVRITETLLPGGAIFSSDYQVSVFVRPKIAATGQPKATTVTEGDTANFTVTVDGTGTAPFSYIWQKKIGTVWTDLGAADSNQLSIPNAQLANAGSYRVKVTNHATDILATAFATSAEAVLKVNSRPVILTQPVSTLNIATGASGVLKVVVVGNAPLSYQWYKGSPGSGVAISKATAATLTVKGNETATTTSGPGDYYVQITNGYSPEVVPGVPTDRTPTVSTVATVNVIRKPTIVTQPLKATVAAGDNTGLTVVPSTDNTGTLSYQWQKDGKNIGDAIIAGPAPDPRTIAGTTTANITFAPVSWLDRGSYKVIIRNEVGTITSAAAVLTVNSPPIIITQPVDAFGATGGSKTFTVVAGGNATLKYQWYFQPVGGSFAPITAGKAAKLTLSKLSASNLGNYKCKVSNSFGDVESNSVFLQVDDAPKITMAPVAAKVKVGNSISLSVVATGTNSVDDVMHFQWQYNNKNIVDAADASTYTKASAVLADSGTYRVIVYNAVGTATSAGALVTVMAPPAIVTDPVDTTGIEDDPLQISLAASGSAPVRYQWEKKELVSPGVFAYAAVAGRVYPALAFPKVQNTDAATYRCKVYNDVETIYSAEATITVTPIPTPTLSYFNPTIARTKEYVRLYGDDLRFTKTVTVGTVAMGFVIESTKSLLLTVPATASGNASNITVSSKNGSASLPGFKRTNGYANAPNNPTLLFGSSFVQVGSTKDIPTIYNNTQPSDAYYRWRVPVASTCTVTVIPTSANFDPDLSLQLLDANGVRIPGSYKWHDYIGSGESLTINTTFDNQEVEIITTGRFSYAQGAVDEGTFNLTCKAVPTSSATSASLTSNETDVGGKGWRTTHAESTRVATAEDGETQAVVFGGETAAKEPVFLWTDAGGEGAGSAIARASFAMSLQPGKAEGDDNFAWQVDGLSGDALIALWFNTSDGSISVVEPDGTTHPSIQHMVPGATHKFEITVDNAKGTWTATMDGVALTDAIALPAGQFGNISAVWDLGPDGVASGATMAFEKFQLTTLK